ncbi:uncharacterized protein LOC107360164 [Tetranychus urticae]|uniref:uncharacterized protein LOC107360164 n=1 Tax=Tetranychus urticae TaxID=32264 RepID=UPI000D65D08E|nr:uncharacterized protein LOC107360164 [Tetranychus urticae]
MDSWGKFEERKLPPINAFFSSLSQKTIDQQTYDRLNGIWNHFECENLGDFHDIYLKVDVLLLTAIFQNFRATSLKQFGLDPCHYFSTPGLTWDAALKFTGMKLDLLTDIDMILMIENAIRGGISCVMSRYAKANNEFTEEYNSEEPTSFIAYLDVNNLYGYALSDILPCRNFAWVPQNMVDGVIDEILNTNQERKTGYILEVDLDYPESLHDEHNDYPLAPEKIIVDNDQLSNFQKEIVIMLEENGVKRYKTKKLVPNLMNKKKYVLHERNLKFYIEKGLILKKVHRIIKFEQEPWLRSYIQMCTENRKRATSSFEKDFWKLMVNSLYGKSIEDKRKHSKVKVATNGRQALQQIRKPMFEQFYILDNDIAIIKLKKFEVILDKPIYLGFTVLELSKLHMYKLHYDHFKPKYESKLSLTYTDTDSFIYKIETVDLFKDLEDFDYLMDFSDYPQNHFLHTTNNKKKLGYLKDEMNGQIIDEVVAIKSKLYAIKYGSNKKLTAKGVQKAVVKSSISIENYKDCLFSNMTKYNIRVRMAQISAKKAGRQRIRLLVKMKPFDYEETWKMIKTNWLDGWDPKWYPGKKPANQIKLPIVNGRIDFGDWNDVYDEYYVDEKDKDQAAVAKDKDDAQLADTKWDLSAFDEILESPDQNMEDISEMFDNVLCLQ